MSAIPQFVIVSPEPYSRRWGGVCALYQLRDALQARGHNVALIVDSERAKQGREPEGETVAILPEIYAGNPTPCRHVVRWILNTPALSGTGPGFLSTDLLFHWSAAFHSEVPGVDCGQLFTSDWRRNIFCDLGGSRRGTCYLVRKGHGKRLDQHPSEALCIDDYQKFGDVGGDQYLADVFNRRARFICYDHATMLSTFAAMCGCETIVIPDGVRTVDQVIAHDPLKLSGVAWGREDLPRAHATRLHLSYLLDDWERQSAASIDAFIQTCQERFAA